MNAKFAAQVEDRIKVEEQKLVPVAKAEEDLFSKIENECIQAIKKLYEDQGFVKEALAVPAEQVNEAALTRLSPQWFDPFEENQNKTWPENPSVHNPILKVSCDDDSCTFWTFETKDGQRSEKNHLEHVREIQPDQVAKVVMGYGKDDGDDIHRLRMLEFYGFDGQRIGDAMGYKCDQDRKIEFHLNKGDRLIGFKRSDEWDCVCVDF